MKGTKGFLHILLLASMMVTSCGCLSSGDDGSSNELVDIQIGQADVVKEPTSDSNRTWDLECAVRKLTPKVEVGWSELRGSVYINRPNQTHPYYLVNKTRLLEYGGEVTDAPQLWYRDVGGSDDIVTPGDRFVMTNLNETFWRATFQVWMGKRIVGIILLNFDL